jgi:hypothetical protein
MFDSVDTIIKSRETHVNNEKTAYLGWQG